MNATFPRFLGAVAVASLALSTSAEASAPAGRYTTAGGTVTDTKTKLTWQQTAAPAAYVWAAAKTYCQTLSLAGTGWRLPTRKELQTIVDYSQSNPSIDPTAFPATLAAAFWSSSPVAGSPASAWLVDFSIGGSYGYGGPAAYYVRCVR
jgi:formylglycine-generating enzyme required for sulfatase activity